MILASYIYDTIQTLIRKDQKGNSFSITEFNRILPVVNLELYNFYTSHLEEGQDITEELKGFMTLKDPVTLTSGVGQLPAYGRMLGVPYTDTAESDLVTNKELTFRLFDELTQPTVEDPITILGGLTGTAKNITVYPDTISSIYINYLSVPVTPVLDFYIDSNGLYVYLDEDATGITIPVGAVYSDGVTTNPSTVNSQTVNLAWDDEQTPAIINSLLQKAGIILDEKMAVEYGVARETKEEQQ